MEQNNLQQKRNKITIIFIGILIFIYLLSLFTFKTESPPVENVDSIMTKQIEMEKEIKADGYTLDNPNIILNPYGNSPLTAIVAFETNEKITPEIIVKGKDELSSYQGLHELTDKHYLPIYGLYADTNNEVIVKTGDKEKVINIQTDPLPKDLPLPINIKSDKDMLINDLYFFTPSSKGYTLAYDVNGDVRWYLTDKMAWDISKLKNGNLLLSTERSINPPYYTTGLYEIDLLGKIYTEYSLPGGYHHDFFEMENGNLIVATDDFEGETVEDYIVELDRKTGTIMKEWDLKDILNIEDGKNENWIPYDWFHNNSTYYDTNTNSIILSGRHQDAVIAIDYDTGKLKWIIGDPTGWSEEYQDYFFTPVDNNNNPIDTNNKDIFEWQWSQHAAMVTPEGYIFILDNGNNKSKNKDEYVKAEDSYTRGVMYEINTDNMTIKQVWQYGKERGHEFYSPYISDVDYIDKGHVLVHSGGIVYVDGKISNRPAGFDTNVELHSITTELLNDEAIFELELPTNMYRAEKFNPYDNFKYEKGGQRELGTLGETINNEYKLKLNDYIKLMNKNKSLDKIEKSHKVGFTKEEDRLVMRGEFHESDEVEIYLVQNSILKKYDVRITETPYTALCINIFQDKENLEIEKYINDENLNGFYKAFIKINDEIYNVGHFKIK